MDFPNSVGKVGIITSLFIKLGLAKDQKQANYVMLMISFLSLSLTIYFIVSTFYPNVIDFNKSKPVVFPADVQDKINALNNQ